MCWPAAQSRSPTGRLRWSKKTMVKQYHQCIHLKQPEKLVVAQNSFKSEHHIKCQNLPHQIPLHGPDHQGSDPIPTRTGRMTLSSFGHGNISFTPSRNGWNLPIRINITQNYGLFQGQIIPWSTLSLSLHTTSYGSTHYLPPLLTCYIPMLNNFFSVLATWHLSFNHHSHHPILLLPLPI